MPKVGKKRFPYTPRGEAQAEAYAQRTGQKMTYSPPKKKKSMTKKRTRK